MELFSVILFVLVIGFVSLHLYNSLSYYLEKININKSNTVSEFKGFSILLPFYNESQIIQTALDGISNTSYPNIEYFFINDGSTDNTLEILKDKLQLKPISRKNTLQLKHKQIFNLYESKKIPNIYVIDKANGGKADSLNAGINLATKDYIVTLDADSILHKEALYIMNEELNSDSKIIALGGSVQLLQGVKGIKNNIVSMGFTSSALLNSQILEYLKGFFIYKLSLSKMNALAIISGCFGVFHKNTLFKVEGFRTTVGEDIDVTIKFQNYAKKHNKKLKYIPKALCFTEGPEGWKDYTKQRIRWQKAFLDAIWFNKANFFNALFSETLSFFLVIEAFVISILANLISSISLFVILYKLIMNQPLGTVFYFLLLIGFIISIINTITAFIVAKKNNIIFNNINIGKFIMLFLFEFIFYRFFNIFTLIVGSISYIFNKEGWNKVSRSGRIYEFRKAS